MMSTQQIGFFVGDKAATLTNAHPAYLSGFEGQQMANGALPALVRALPEGSLYVDIGANVGATVVVAALLRPDLRIIAFEPVPSNFRFLEQNITANDITNCTLVNAAVGEHPGELLMNDNGPWSLIGAGTTRVKVVTLDDYFIANPQISSIGLLKVDVEGYEPNVIFGAKQTIEKSRAPIFMEFNSWTLLCQGVSPLDFAAQLWSIFSVSSPHDGIFSSSRDFVHNNIVKHGCVDDVVLQINNIAELNNFSLNTHAARQELDAVYASTSWRLTAPLRSLKHLIAR
jgi:FkbM family methyltransferase